MSSKSSRKSDPAPAPGHESLAADGARLVRIGRISGLHALKGALRFTPDNPDSTILQTLRRVFVETAAGVGKYQVREVARVGRGRLSVTLAGVTTAERAQALVGGVMMVAREDLPPAAPGEFYYFEAIGCAVVTTDGRELGTIAEVFHTGANDVWVVREGKTEVLIPAIDNVVRSFDTSARRVVIEAVPGLLD